MLPNTAPSRMFSKQRNNISLVPLLCCEHPNFLQHASSANKGTTLVLFLFHVVNTHFFYNMPGS